MEGSIWADDLSGSALPSPAVNYRTCHSQTEGTSICGRPSPGDPSEKDILEGAHCREPSHSAADRLPAAVSDQAPI